MIRNKKRNQIVNELFIKGRKLKVSTAFITECYLAVLKDVRLNSTQFYMMKIPDK